MSYPVLVADDNRATAKMLGKLLDFAGYQSLVTYSGQEALEELAYNKPKVAMLDLSMPGMDGYEVAKKIRADKRFSDLVLVALTGHGEVEDKLRAREAGFNHHIQKPASLDDIRRVLNIYEIGF